MAIATRETELGCTLPPISMQMSREKFRKHEPKQQPGRTIHDDDEAAAREGLPAPIAGGPMVAATIYRMMLAFLGEGWIKGGKIYLKFIKPVFEHDFVTAKGIVKEKVLEDSGVRLVCDVWAERQGGEKVIVGTASGLVP